MPRAGPGILIRMDPRFMRIFRQKIERLALFAAIDFPTGVREIAERTLEKVKMRTPEGDPEDRLRRRRRITVKEGWILADETRSTAGIQRWKIKNKIAGWAVGRKILFILEYGSREHRIRARRAKSLHWERPTSVHHFRKEVLHPGTEPFAMLRTSSAEASIEMTGLAERMAAKMARIWGAK